MSGFGYQILGFGSGGESGPDFVEATGGNSTFTSGNFKIHVFTGDGNLCVASVGSPAGSETVDYLVVAGGGGGGTSTGGGGGGGGSGARAVAGGITAASLLASAYGLPPPFDLPGATATSFYTEEDDTAEPKKVIGTFAAPFCYDIDGDVRRP